MVCVLTKSYVRVIHNFFADDLKIYNAQKQLDLITSTADIGMVFGKRKCFFFNRVPKEYYSKHFKIEHPGFFLLQSNILK